MLQLYKVYITTSTTNIEQVKERFVAYYIQMLKTYNLQTVQLLNCWHYH